MNRWVARFASVDGRSAANNDPNEIGKSDRKRSRLDSVQHVVLMIGFVMITLSFTAEMGRAKEGNGIAGSRAYATTNQDDQQAAADRRVVEALMRLPNFDLDSRPQVKTAIDRYLTSVEGTDRFVEVIEKLNYVEAADRLMQLAAQQPNTPLGVSAVRTVLKMGQRQLIRDAIQDDEAESTKPIMQAIGRIGNQATTNLLERLALNRDRLIENRTQAIRSLGLSQRGQLRLLELLEADEIPSQLRFATGDVLHASTDASIRNQVAEMIPRPASADSEPLPPIAELITLRGNADSGQVAFAGVGTCANCHKVNGEGKEVGPDLTEIGSKLSRSALFESILDPSAGISHNYESYMVATLDGVIITGILVSETDSTVVLKDAEAFVHEIPQDDIDEMVKQTTSIMPDGIVKELSQAQLVDIVEFLTTLTASSD